MLSFPMPKEQAQQYKKSTPSHGIPHILLNIFYGFKFLMSMKKIFSGLRIKIRRIFLSTK
jgi:hypothetical protein